MSGPPRIPLHVGDYLKDTPPVSRVNWEHHGIYLLALMIAWNVPGCRLPDDDKWLAERFGCTVTELQEHVRPVLLRYFKKRAKWLTQKRLCHEHDRSGNFSEKQRQRRKSGWDKQKEAYRGSPVVQPGLIHGVPTTPTPTILEDSKKDALTGVQRKVRPSGRSSEPPLAVADQREPKAALARDMAAVWNRICGDVLPKARGDPPKTRQQHMLARYAEMDRSIENWEGVCHRVRASYFLTGQTMVRNGREPFRATLDWVLAQGNFKKITEGNYDNRGKSGRENIDEWAARLAQEHGQHGGH